MYRKYKNNIINKYKLTPIKLYIKLINEKDLETSKNLFKRKDEKTK